MDNKYFTSESVELLRSQIKLHEQNPRTIPEENRKALKRGIKKFGMVGGIVVNKRTGYTLCKWTPATFGHGRTPKVQPRYKG